MQDGLTAKDREKYRQSTIYEAMLVPLIVEDKTIGWYYPQWRTIFGSKETALQHIVPKFCCKCGAQVGFINSKEIKSYATHDDELYCCDCNYEYLLDHYEQVTEDKYNGEPVIYGDEYYEELEDCYDAIYYDVGDGGKMPNRLQLAEEAPLPKISVDHLLENLLNHCDVEDTSADELYTDIDELASFICNWNEKQTGKLFIPSKRVLVLSEKTKQEIMSDD